MDDLGIEMDRTLTWVGLALAFVGSVPFHSEPAGFNRAKAVGLSLFAVGEVLLWGVAWWWALIGLVAPSIIIEAVVAIASLIRRPR